MTRAFVSCCIATCVLALRASAAHDLSTVEGFEAAFRQANASKDLRRLEQLVWWERATPKASQNMRAALRQELGHPIRRIEVARFSWADAIYPPRNPNLRPAHFFTVWSVSGRDRLGAQITGRFYTLGKNDGRFYLIVSDQWPVATMHYE